LVFKKKPHGSPSGFFHGSASRRGDIGAQNALTVWM
jgi:hypothetical protein